MTQYLLKEEYVDNEIKSENEGRLPEEFTPKSHQHPDGVHVPIGWTFVTHFIECIGNMTVAVVAAEIVL